LDFLYGWGYVLEFEDEEGLLVKVNGSKRHIRSDAVCVELDGEGTLTVKSIREAIKRKIRISVKSKHGRVMLDPHPLVINQVSKFLNDEERIKVSRAVTQAASLNKLYVLKLLGLKGCEEYLKIERLMDELAKSSTVWGLMSIEAEVAKSYYEALRRIIPSEYGFTARSRRPPRDPVSASISFLNMMLYQICTRALRYYGLDERIGFLHEPRGERASLALDLAEEFKQPLVDAAVIPAFTSRSMKKWHFTYSINGVFLNKRGMSKMLKLFRHRLNLRTSKGRLEEQIYLQASKLAEWVLGLRKNYEPFILTLEV